jgi:hypothetical protein
MKVALQKQQIRPKPIPDLTRHIFQMALQIDPWILGKVQQQHVPSFCVWMKRSIQRKLLPTKSDIYVHYIVSRTFDSSMK